MVYIWSAEHASDALITLQWLRVPERMQYKLVLLVFLGAYTASRQTTALQLVSIDGRDQTTFARSNELPLTLHGRPHHLRSASAVQLLVPPVHLAIVGSRAFELLAPQSEIAYIC